MGDHHEGPALFGEITISEIYWKASQPSNPDKIILLSKHYINKKFLLSKFTFSYDNKMIRNISVLLSQLSGMAINYT